MPQQLQSDLCVVAETQQPQHRPPLPKLDILAVNANEEHHVVREAENDAKEDHSIRTRSKLPIKKKNSICWTRRCMSTSPKRKHGHERDAPQLASNGSILTRISPNSHVAARVWCARKCAIKETNRSSRQHCPWSSTSYTLCCVSGRRFRVGDSSLIAIADVSRAHFFADAVRDFCVRLPNILKRSKCTCETADAMCGSLDAALW